MSNIKLPNGELLEVPCAVEEVSDGYHSFSELYQHRCLLFILAMKSSPQLSWYADRHDDGSKWEGWIVAGMNLPTGMITYHLPNSMVPLLEGITHDMVAPVWDGHTPDDVLKRLEEYLRTPQSLVKLDETIAGWSAIDVNNCANQYDYKISSEDAAYVLSRLSSNFDANVGIDWDIIWGEILDADLNLIPLTEEEKEDASTGDTIIAGEEDET